MVVNVKILRDKSRLCCLLQTEIDGLTGVIRFDEEGHRRNFSLQVMEMTIEGDMMKVSEHKISPVTSYVRGIQYS